MKRVIPRLVAGLTAGFPLVFTFTVAVTIPLPGCGDDEAGIGLDIPEGFPDPRIPDDNPITAEAVELGRHLFYDERLSGNQTQSCSSCHHQELAFSDGEVLPKGSTGETIPRNSPSLANVAYNATLTWANPILTELEQQLLIPIFGENPVELGATGKEDEILQRFVGDPLYDELFAAAFPNEADPVSWGNIVDALSSFNRSLISGDSPYDRFVFQGDNTALSEAELRGMELFYSERLECHHCHGGFNFTESTVHTGLQFDAVLFHNTGLYNIDGSGAYPPDNTGIFEITGEPGDMGRFRPPTLRNIALTAPYMHDGSIATLEEVLRFYEAGGRVITEGPFAGDGRSNPFKSGLVPGFTLTDEERADVVTFLETLTDTTFIENPRLSNPFQSDSAATASADPRPGSRDGS